MDNAQYLDALRRDSAALLAAAREAEPTAAIAACPGWRPADLAWHVGEVQWFWGSVVAGRVTDPDTVAEPDRPETDDEVFAFADASARRLTEALGAADPGTEVWTWSDQHDVAFVIRRMAQETAVHRVDAERAAGRDHQVDPDLAADGIDEFLAHFLPRARADAPAVDGSVHVHCVDADGEWTVTTGDDGRPSVAWEHAKADAALRGEAHDLLMVLWRRAPLESVEIFGDRGVAERFVARTNLE